MATASELLMRELVFDVLTLLQQHKEPITELELEEATHPSTLITRNHIPRHNVRAEIAAQLSRKYRVAMNHQVGSQ